MRRLYSLALILFFCLTALPAFPRIMNWLRNPP